MNPETYEKDRQRGVHLTILIILTLMMGQTSGATRQEIMDALGSDKTYERFFKMVHEMYRQCSEEQSVLDENGEHKGGGSVTAANALFVRKDIRDSLNPEYLISTTMITHNAIHYGDETLLVTAPIIRTKNDTCLWKSKG